jgi:predicted nucleic acid-binding protein
VNPKPRLLWDSSALIDAVLAPAESPYYELLDLGESGAIDMRISTDVLRESERIVGRYGRDLLSLLAIVLADANFATTPAPANSTVDHCMRLTGYRNDAKIVAAAEECLADILVTWDRQHFLDNPLISPPDTHCRAKSPVAALDWCRHRLISGD